MFRGIFSFWVFRPEGGQFTAHSKPWLVVASVWYSAMGSRRIRALGVLDAESVKKFDNVGWARCEDALTQPLESVARLLDIDLAAAERIIDAVAAKIAPPAAPLLSLPQCGFIRTSLPSLDASMGGGIPGGYIVEVVGPPGVGKSQFAMMTAALCASDEQGGVLYIDTERKYSHQRVAQVAQKDVASRLHVREAATLSGLLALCDDLELQVAEVGARLVVIDSVAAVVRCEDLSAVARSQLLSKLAVQLKHLAHRYGLAVILTNQVTADSQAALGNTWHHAVHIRLRLSLSAEGIDQAGQVRLLTVDKSHMSANVAVPYRITATGVTEHRNVS